MIKMPCKQVTVQGPAPEQQPPGEEPPSQQPPSDGGLGLSTGALVGLGIAGAGVAIAVSQGDGE